MNERLKPMLVLAAVACTFALGWVAAPYLWVLSNAERATATVVSTRVSDRPHGSHVDLRVTPRFAFMTSDGGTIEKQAPGGVVTRLEFATHAPGQRVQVFYRRDAPSEFVEEPELPFFGIAGFFAAWAVLLMALGVWPLGSRLARRLGVSGLGATLLRWLVTLLALALSVGCITAIGWGLRLGPPMLPTALVTTVIAGLSLAVLVPLIRVRVRVLRFGAPSTDDWQDNGFGPLIAVGLFCLLSGVLSLGWWFELITRHRELTALRRHGEWVAATVTSIDRGTSDVTRTASFHHVVVTWGARTFERDDVSSRVVEVFRVGQPIKVLVDVNHPASLAFEFEQPSVAR